LPNVDVLTSGPTPPNPTELLVGSYFQELLNQATGRYDQIIIDGPPVLLVTDVLAMAGRVDGMIMVCRAKASSRGAILRAREQLQRVNARIFGAVLNAAVASRGGYFREQIRTYYDYQPDEALTGRTAPELPRRDEPQNNSPSGKV
jgi:capsular exopolysaccharide synthesis family protein